MKIDKTRWQEAQHLELKHHKFSNDMISTFDYVYNNMFRLLNVDKNSLKDKKILEIGPAFFPALCYINCKSKFVIEPMFDSFSKEVKNYYALNEINVTTKIIEDTDTYSLDFYDEIWLFNVLAHVVDPIDIIEKCKLSSNVVRFFEPINTGTDICHPHTFDLEFFKKNFDHDCVNLYSGKTIQNFHDADCAFGTFIR